MKPIKYIAAIAIPAFLIAQFLLGPRDHSNADLFAYWLSGLIHRTGGDPYSPAQWTAGYQQLHWPHQIEPSFLYPLPLSILLSPLSLLAFQPAFVLWTALSLTALACAVLLLASFYPNVKHFLLPLLAGALLFRPVWAMLDLGQLSAFLLLDLVGVVWLWRKGRWFAGGLLLSLLALKPNLGVPLLLLAGLWLLIGRRWLALAGIATGGIVLAIIGWLADPSWVVKFFAIGGNKFTSTFGSTPTVWGLAAWASGFRPALGIPLGILAAIACAGLLAWQLRRMTDPLQALSGIVLLTLLITPYLWSYDQTLLLLPIVVCTLSLIARMPYILGAFLPLGMAFLAVLFQMVAMRYQLDLVNAQLSLVVLALWLVASWIGDKRHMIYDTRLDNSSLLDSP